MASGPGVPIQPAKTTRSPSRRALLRGLGAGAISASMAPALAQATAPPTVSQGSRAALSKPLDAKLVRLSSVVTPQDGGLYAVLLPDFTKQTGLNIELTTAEAVYDPARIGRADVVLSHFGHHDIKAFMD